MFSAYLLFEQLPDDVKAKNKIKVGASVPRLDCTALAGYYEPLESIKNPKGQIMFYLQQTRGIIDSPDKRRAGYFLQAKDSQNFSSIYPLTSEGDLHFAYGEPNNQKLLKNGKPNPFLPYKETGYIFIHSTDYKRVEVLVIENGRYLIQGYAKQIANGQLNEALEGMRQKAKPIFEY